MDRRSFLSLFGAAAIGATLDPEKLLWIPGQKTIFLPSVTSFTQDLPLMYPLDMVDVIVGYHLRDLDNQLALMSYVHRAWGHAGAR